MAKIKQEKALKEILKFYKKHIKYYILFIIILIIKAVISFFSAMLVAKIIACIMEANYSLTLHYALVNLIILVIYNILGYLNTFFYKKLENNVRFDLQQKVIESSLNIKMSYYDNAGSGVVVTRLTNDIDKISESFKSLTEKIVNVIRRITYLLYIFFLNIYLGLFVLGGVVIVSILYTIRIHYLKKLKPGVKMQKEVVNSKIIEVIRAIKDIKTLNCDESVLNLVGKEQKTYMKKDNFEYYVGNGLCKLTDLVISIVDYFYIVLSIILLKDYGLTTTCFYTCYLYKDHTFNLAIEMGDFLYKFAECEVCAQRLISLVYPSKENIDKYGTKYNEIYKGDITFKDVSFSYLSNKPLLNNVSFKIDAKTTTAFVGESGAGKSTIINLIGHLYYKDSGQILFGPHDIDEVSKEFIRENITIVNQFPYLFNLSIKENFLMVKKDITEEEIWQVCNKTLLKDFIESLPKKLDSIIGEGGCQLSGGQRQRLAIARALCRNSKVLIFDEATSSLDNNSQKEVMEVIKRLEKEMTIILIAHRLTTVTYANKIILLKNGKIKDVGTHEDLFANNKYYKMLYLKNSAE